MIEGIENPAIFTNMKDYWFYYLFKCKKIICKSLDLITKRRQKMSQLTAKKDVMIIKRSNLWKNNDFAEVILIPVAIPIFLYNKIY